MYYFVSDSKNPGKTKLTPLSPYNKFKNPPMIKT